jgi:hypothetical protein
MTKDSNNNSFHTKENEQQTLLNISNHEELQTVQDCKNCDNIACKCQLIMLKIEDVMELTTQIEHFELFNIMLTIYGALKNLHDDETILNKILSACQETYTEINPKEMHKILN